MRKLALLAALAAALSCGACRSAVAPQLAEVYPQFTQRVFGVSVIPAERSESRNP